MSNGAAGNQVLRLSFTALAMEGGREGRGWCSDSAGFIMALACVA